VKSARAAESEGVAWDDLDEALRQYSAATGLSISAFDARAVLRIGPVLNSDLARFIDSFGVWREGGSASVFEARLARQTIEQGSRQRASVSGDLQLLSEPIVAAGNTIGAIVFGWVYNKFPTSLGTAETAKELGVDAVRLWAKARLENPVAEERLAVSAQLLATILQTMARHARAVAELHALAHQREEFLAFVSHELRTPLAALSARLQLLVRGTLSAPEVIREELNKMRRHVQEESRLIEDLIDAARSETGQLTVALKPTALLDILGRAVDAVRPTAEAKNIELVDMTADHGGRAVLLLADADRLQQVFWNLLTNAAKFTPAGGRITVSLAEEDAQIQVAVSDTGSGIDAAILPLVFDRFMKRGQGNASGLGVGLSIAKGIVEQHGGSISARSEGPGTGSTFVVVLPRHPTKAS